MGHAWHCHNTENKPKQPKSLKKVPIIVKDYDHLIKTLTNKRSQGREHSQTETELELKD